MLHIKCNHRQHGEGYPCQIIILKRSASPFVYSHALCIENLFNIHTLSGDKGGGGGLIEATPPFFIYLFIHLFIYLFKFLAFMIFSFFFLLLNFCSNPLQVIGLPLSLLFWGRWGVRF